VAYIPKYLPVDAPKDSRHDRFVVVSDDREFSPGQVLRTWEDLLQQGHAPDQILLLGFGGGSLAAVEYHVALALGASVGAVQKTEGAAEAILDNPVWSGVLSLMAVPLDEATMQALSIVPSVHYDAGKLEEMAQAVHVDYVQKNPKKLPENMRPWDILCETFKTANREQARYMVEILQAVGFKVRPVSGTPVIFSEFSPEEINMMAELEHGRWNIERLRNGWRPGKPRDDARKIHDCLISWAELPDEIKGYDRKAVKAFPAVLAKAGLEVVRR